MFRIAALVAGALAGFVASLILALGGLEVSASAFGGLGERQLALARFGLIFIANLSLLGAGVSLAIPRAGAILLLLAGAAWAAAALYLGHSTDLVLFGPPALALLGFILAIVGSFRGRQPAPAGLTEPLVADYAPPDPYDVTPVAARGKPASALAPLSPLSTRDPLDGMPERDFSPSRLTGRNERQPPPRTTETPTFRELDDEDDEDYEPSFARRVGSGVASLLSFGLYAAAAASVLLVLWNVYQRDNSRALVADTAPPASPSVAAVAPTPSSSSQPSLAPAPVVVVTPAPTPSSLPPPVSVAATPQVAPAPSSQSSEPVRLVGEPPPANAAPAATTAGVSSAPPPPSSSIEPEPSSAEPPAVAVAETGPLPTPDFVDATKSAPIPATMSPELAAARRAGTFDNVQPDSFAIAPGPTASDI